MNLVQLRRGLVPRYDSGAGFPTESCKTHLAGCARDLRRDRRDVLVLCGQRPGQTRACPGYLSGHDYDGSSGSVSTVSDLLVSGDIASACYSSPSSRQATRCCLPAASRQGTVVRGGSLSLIYLFLRNL